MSNDVGSKWIGMNMDAHKRNKRLRAEKQGVLPSVTTKEFANYL